MTRQQRDSIHQTLTTVLLSVITIGVSVLLTFVISINSKVSRIDKDQGEQEVKITRNETDINKIFTIIQK